MKTVKILSLMTLVAICLFTSCKKSDDAASSSLTSDVTDDMAASLSSSNSGVSSELSQVTSMNKMVTSKSLALSTALTDTLYKKDTTFTAVSSISSSVTYNYSLNMKYGYVYANNSLSNMYCNNTISGSYSGVRLSSTENRTGKWVLTGFSSSLTEYTLNGTINISRSTQSKVRNKSTLSSVSQITVTNVKVNKTTHVITSGTLTWTISGKVNSIDYSYTAVVTYMGSGVAQIVLNGTTYTVSLATGLVQ